MHCVIKAYCLCAVFLNVAAWVYTEYSESPVRISISCFGMMHTYKTVRNR